MVEFNPKEYLQMKKRFSEDESQLDFLVKQLSSLKKEEERRKEILQRSLEARLIIQLVAQDTVSNLEVHLSSLGTMALSAVSNKWPDFVAEVKIQRNQVELHLLFEEHDRKQKPLDSSGFGPCDVADYAMQIAFWCLDKNRPTILLDEPFRNVSPGLQHKVSQMVERITEELGIQQIMISHAKNINTAADRTFFVEKTGKISKVVIEEA